MPEVSVEHRVVAVAHFLAHSLLLQSHVVRGKGDDESGEVDEVEVGAAGSFEPTEVRLDAREQVAVASLVCLVDGPRRDVGLKWSGLDGSNPRPPG